MLIVQREKSTERLGRLLPITQLDDAAIDQAREIFTDYRRRGIILNGSFDDPVWRMSNETNNVKLSLLSFESDGNASRDWLGVSTNKYTECVKAYISLKFGDFQLLTLQVLAKTLSTLPNMIAGEAALLTKNAARIAEFLSLLPGEAIERDCVGETLTERAQAYRKASGVNCRRVLATFDNYLRFNEAIADYWKTACVAAKLFYYPIYLWWNLTSILPLRPTEFLLTPRSCLDGNVLTVRRSRLKGSGKTAYRISQDYESHKYEITPTLASEFREYIALTEHMPPSRIDALFRLEPHYSYFGRDVDHQDRYYSYQNIRTCLGIFFSDVLAHNSIKIERIKLGDTRHLAMISLIISGGSPVICRELAGHADIAISSHYYSNVSILVECVTIGRFRRSKGGGMEFVGEPRYPIKRPDNMLRLSDGWCDAPYVKDGDVGECMKVVDNHGRIGECSSCGHYWSDVPGIRARFFDEIAGKQRVDLDSEFLLRMIELVRRGVGCEEDIASALLRLQHSCNHYGDCLTMKYSNAEA
jgi:hypothetical protein